MPNRPDNPYERLPLKTVLGLLLMLLGAVALLFLSSTWRDWRQAILGALVLFGLIGLAAALRRLNIPRFTAGKTKIVPISPKPEPTTLPGFDPASFIEATKRRHQAAPLRQIENEDREGRAAEMKRSRGIGSETVRRLQDIRDHPATPDAERKTADDILKKQRTKRRSAWRKGP